MAENIDVNVNVNTTAAQRNLDNFNKKVTTMQRGLAALRSVVGGLALGGFAASLLNSADAMDDVAESTDLALTSVLGFSEAVRQNGGDTNDAVSAMQKFVLSLQEARDGSLATQLAFQKLGISTQQLSEDNTTLFVKSIEGFKNLGSAAEQAKVKNEIFGKSLRGVAIGDVANQFATISVEQRQYVQATKDAADAQKELNKFTTSLIQNLLPLAKVLGDVAKFLNQNKQAIKSFIETAIEIGKIAALFFVVYRAVSLLVQGAALLSAGWAGFLVALKGIAKTFSAFRTQLRAVAREGAITNETFKGLQKRWEYLKRDVPILAQGIAVLTTALYAAYQAGKKFLGLGEDFSKPLLIMGQGAQAAPTGFDSILQYIKARRDAAEQDQKARERLVEMANSLRDATDAFKQQNDEILRNLDLTKESLITSADEIEIQNALIDNSERLRKALEDLQKQRDAAAVDPEKASLVPVIEEEMNKVRENAALTHDSIIQKITDIQQLRLEQEKYNHTLEQAKNAITSGETIQALQDQLSLVGQYGQELENNLVRLDVQRELESTLNALAVRALELEQQRVQLGEARYQQEMNNLLALTDAAYRYADARLEAEQKILDAQNNSANKLKQHLKQREEDLKASLDPAARLIDLTKRFDQEIDNFVETGKFRFKDMIGSWVKDWLAAEAKLAATQLFKQIFSGAMGAIGGGVAGFIGKIFGFANGGNPPVNKPSIVGEKGPELFVPKQAGTIIPNNQLGSKGMATGAVNAPVTNNYITNNINAIDAKSVAQLFAENRKTLLGSVKMAEREMPYMAR